MISCRRIVVVGLCLLFMSLESWAAPKYRLTWGYKRKRVNEFKRTIVFKRYAYRIAPQGDNFDIEQAIKNFNPKRKRLSEMVKAECILKWTVPKMAGYKAFVCVYLQKGKLTYIKGRKKIICDLTKAKDCAKASKIEELRKYISMASGAYAFQIDLRKGKVLQTWALERDTRGRVRQVLFMGPHGDTDPLHFGESYRQLPNRTVPIGTKWTCRQVLGPKHSTYNFHFVGLSKHRGRDVVKIEVNGTVTKNNPKLDRFLGTISGEYLLDYKRQVMYYQMLNVLEIDIYKKQRRGVERYYVFEEHNEIKLELQKTNAH